MPRKKGQTNRSIKGRTIKVNPSYSPLFPFTINNKIIDEMRKFTGTETQPQPVPEEYRLYINNLNYPIGSVFMTMVPNITPFDILGIGTWEQINSDYTIRTASSNQAGSVHQGNTTIGNLSVSIPSLTTNAQALSVTIPQHSTDMSYVQHTHIYDGLSQGHALTIDEIPSHNHRLKYFTWGWDNSNATESAPNAQIHTGGSSGTALATNNNNNNWTENTGGNTQSSTGAAYAHFHSFSGTTQPGGSAHDHDIASLTINNTGSHSHNIDQQSVNVDMSYINVTYWIRIA